MLDILGAIELKSETMDAVDTSKYVSLSRNYMLSKVYKVLWNSRLKDFI